MRKNIIGLLALILILNISFVSAIDIAYIVKDTRYPDSAFVSALNELNLSYELIDDSSISKTDFSKYKMLLIGDEAIRDAPVNNYPSLIVNPDYYSDWASFITSLASSTPLKAYNLQHSITKNMNGWFQAYTQSKNNQGTNLQIYLLEGRKNSLAITTKGNLSYDLGYFVLAYKDKPRRVWFGITESAFWTQETKKLFKNSISWVRLGADMDGDSFYSDIDCNDNNPSINPNASEIAYNYIDENCDNYDSADIDGDGYCLSGYNIQNKFLQCLKETGNIGSDCDDANSNINPDASEIMNNIDENCRNDAPFLAREIPDLSWNEDESVILNLNDYFADYENDNLVFSVYNKSGNIISEVNNIANLSASRNWNGNAWIILKASDSNLYGLSNIVNIFILAVNDAPVLQDIEEIKIIEGQKARIIANATEVDNDILVYSINDTRFNQISNGIFEWQTGYEDAGTWYVLVSVSDGFLQDSKIIKINIAEKLVINEFLPHPSTGSEFVEIYNPRSSDFNLLGCYIEDEARKHIQLNGIIKSKSFFIKEINNTLNNDGDTIKLYCNGDLLDDIIYGDTGIQIPGTDKSAARISDGYDTDSASDWKIYDYPTKGISNLADMLAPIVSLTSPENNFVFNSSYVLFNYSVSDNSASLLNCSLYSDVMNKTFKLAASQTTQNGTQNNFSMNDIENNEYTWQVKCKDERNIGESEIRDFRVNVPKAPVLQKIVNITINETEIARILINATDSNPEDSLTYFINDTRFSKTAENIFEWQTGYEDAGTWHVLVSVSDGMFNSSQQVKISVLNKNRAPILIKNIEDKTLDEDTTQTINLTEYFADLDKDILIYRARGNLNINISITNGIASLIPKKDWNGVEQIIFTANDSKSSTDSNPVNIPVVPVNDAPVLKPLNDITATETDSIRIIANATDVDSDSLTYNINDTRFIQQENIFEWQTGYEDAGTWYVLVSVSDGILNSIQTLKITINDKNQLPNIFIEKQEISEDSGVHYVQINATDNDGYISEFKILQENKIKCSVNYTDFILRFETEENYFGNASCIIQAIDDKNGKSNFIFNISVIPVNDAPEIISYSPGFNPIIPENGKQIFSISARDIDSPISQLKAEWLVDNISTGIIGNSFEYKNSGGEHEIKVIATDSQGSAEKIWKTSTSNMPIADKYDGETTNFSDYTSFESINLILEKTNTGKIEFLKNVDLRDAIDFDHYSEIDSGLVALDTGYFSSLAGKPAKITLNNLNFDKTPTIYYNPEFILNKSQISQVCPSNICSNISYANGTMIFTGGFSSFKIGETPSCSELSGFVCKENEECKGNFINAIESRCCLQACSETPPGFSDADTCNNISDDIGIEIEEPDSEDDFSIGDSIKVSLKIRNRGDKDREIDVKAYLYDLTEDNAVKDDKESVSIDKGKKEEVEFNFKISDSLDEKDDYAIFVYAEDENNNCNQKYNKIDIERERHKLIIRDVRIEPEILICGESADILVNVKNIGKHDEDVKIKIENSELGIEEESPEFSLEKSDSELKSERFAIKIPEDAKAGNYKLNVRALFNSRETTETATLVLDECIKEEITEKEIVSEISKPEPAQVARKSNLFYLNVMLVAWIIIFLVLIIVVYRLRR